MSRRGVPASIGQDSRDIPVYLGQLPESDDVDIVATLSVRFPFIPDSLRNQARRGIASVKRKLARALSVDQQGAVDTLAEIADELDEIHATFGAKDSCSFKACVLRFPMLGVTTSHVAFVGPMS